MLRNGELIGMSALALELCADLFQGALDVERRVDLINDLRTIVKEGKVTLEDLGHFIQFHVGHVYDKSSVLKVLTELSKHDPYYSDRQFVIRGTRLHPEYRNIKPLLESRCRRHVEVSL